ncbi:methionine--tRNA ligase [Crateriforma conspicua]|uniref:Methionine--tRNA ligase n=1 Tax=Crateriforma conspicua TaxID=2527996 RepID=A0A5C5YD19_9PLAN|nr:methionine--tRNA ligase [Crateriforma conspicua]QDV61396.1 Methionine--tRNA ligase [Crateriforma conspicua]TWT72351.1 Methionine--tRNA ligase [Crateriforma conspicua]
MTRRLLVTSALPYANGPIHIGHLVEYIQTDIWVRFQKLMGNRAIYMCADDTHGTAIMIRAKAEGRSEEALIASMSEAHQRDFAGFDIRFDHYGSTHSEENRQLCHQFWESLRKAGLIAERSIEQLYDPEAETFLADRFVRGTCPVCGLEGQAGDNCNNGHTYSPTELIDPKSTLSGATPVLKEATHLFVELEKLHDFLNDWVDSADALQSETANYLKGYFLSAELKDWDISRPAPYFGFEIPDAPGNYWYVWFDAPIGYIASTAQWCAANNETLADWWQSDDCEVHHFIGKDITYFHTLFWPGMLKTAGFSLPTKVHIHGFLNVDGKKMSKRDGTLVAAETYLKHLEPSYLRYFYATKLTSRVEDLDLGLDEFAEKVNSDLVGKVVNLASRVGKFAAKLGLSKTYPEDGGLFQAAAAKGKDIADAYEQCEYAKAMRLIMELADAANPFVEHAKPWEMKKDPEREDELRDICTVALNLFRQLAIYLSPVLPKLAQQCGELLNDPITSWEQSQTPLVGSPVNKFQRMMNRVQVEDLQKMIDEGKQESAADEKPVNPFGDSDQPLKDEPIADEITIDDFAKVDLRVARVLSAEQVPEANKLLKLTLGLGGDETRQVFAGIKAAYEPEKLVGRLVVMVANLKPRKMRFGLSEGMVTAAGPGGADVFVLGVDDGALPGQRVH